jgi:hypothetical protein
MSCKNLTYSTWFCYSNHVGKWFSTLLNQEDIMTIKSNVMQQVVMGSIAEGSKPSKVVSADDVELSLNQKQLASIGDSVNATIKSEDLEFNASELRDDIARSLSKVIGTDPTYEWWELVRTTWENTYMARKNLSNEKSANNAWLDNAKRMKAKFNLEKPAKGSKDSARMSEKRAKEQAELQAKTDSVLREEMLAYKADDDFKKADRLKAELERREKLNKAGDVERRKARQALLGKAVKKIADDNVLNQMWALVPESIKLDIAQSK